MSEALEKRLTGALERLEHLLERVDRWATEHADSFSVPDAAKRLGVSAKTVWRRIDDGTIRATRLEGRTLISAEELRRVATQGSRRRRG